MKVTFRRAVTADVPKIVELLADDDLGASREVADTGGEIDPRYRSAFAAIDEDPRQLLIVAESGGVVVGTLQLSFIPNMTHIGGERAQVEGVRVCASHRGKRIGRQMFEYAIAASRDRGCCLVQLTTDKRRADARRFYESIGFKATHEGMKLSLDPRTVY